MKLTINQEIVDLNPSINLIKSSIFPGGEVYTKIENSFDLNNTKDNNYIYAKIKSSDDLMKVLMIPDSLKRIGNHEKNILICYYLPYARQDRPCEEGESLSVKLFASMIKNAGYDAISVLDLHSDVSRAVFDIPVNELDYVKLHALSIMNLYFTESSINKFEKIYLICPDNGARKKILKVEESLQLLRLESEILYFDKKRIERQIETILPQNFESLDLKNKLCVIVDDICDGGGTFLPIGKLLKEKEAITVLRVTHGIFSKSVNVLFENFNFILTTNSWTNLESSNQLKIQNLYDDKI